MGVLPLGFDFTVNGDPTVSGGRTGYNTANQITGGGAQANYNASPAGSNAWLASSASNIPVGQVLPASTVNNPSPQQKTTSNNNNTNNNAFPANQYIGWDPVAAQADWNAKIKAGTAGTGGSVDLGSLISSAYGPALQALQDIEGKLYSSRDENIGNINTTAQQSGESISREQNSLQSSLDQQSADLEKSGRSAFAEAMRNVNNLFQTLAARYGQGASTGGAASEIIGQQYLRNNGQMQQQLEQGRQQIGQQVTQMKNYIADKMDQLDQWKRTTIASINDQFNQNMAQIAMRRGDIEANKTQDRVAALQNALSQAQNVQNQEMQFKQGLAQFAVENMTKFTNKAFTPQEIAGVVNSMLNQNISGLSANTAINGEGFSNYYNPTLTQKQKDDLKSAGLLG